MKFNGWRLIIGVCLGYIIIIGLVNPYNLLKGWLYYILRILAGWILAYFVAYWWVKK